MLFFQQGLGCCSTLTRLSMSWVRGCSMEACERISHFFYVLLSAVRLESGPYFLRPLFLAATCPCALRQSTDALGRISSTFYAKSGLGSPCSSHLEIWNYFYEQYSGSGRTSRTCVTLRCFWKNSTYFHRVGCPGFSRAVRT